MSDWSCTGSRGCAARHSAEREECPFCGTRRPEQQSRNARVLALLKRIERQGVGDQCPYCRESLSIWVHAPDCELAALIRELEGEPRAPLCDHLVGYSGDGEVRCNSPAGHGGLHSYTLP